MKKKKLIFALLIGFVMVFSCKTADVSQKPRETTPGVSIEKKNKKFIYFNETQRPNLMIGDTLKLYNSFNIQITRTIIVHHPAITPDGALGDKDTTYQVTKTIPAKTPGGVLAIQRNAAGNLIKVTLKHSLKDDTYIVDYFLEDHIRYLQAKSNSTIKDPKTYYQSQVKKPGSFVLGGTSTLIFKNKEYELLNKTINSNGEETRLMVEDQRSLQNVPVIEQAEGWTLSKENSTQTTKITQTKETKEEEKETKKSNFVPSEF